MKRFYLLILSISTIISIYAQKRVEVYSPNGDLYLNIKIDKDITYNVDYKNKSLLQNCCMQLKTEDNILGENPYIIRSTQKEVNEYIIPIIPLKQSKISNNYNKLILKFKGGYDIEFRVYNDALAYRFITHIKKKIRIYDEKFSIGFITDNTIHAQQSNNFKTSCEEAYNHLDSRKWKSDNKKTLLPLLIDTPDNIKILISESDLYDYPGMFLESSNNNGITSIFPKVPILFGDDGDRSVKIDKEAEYIAQTDGERSFPWRFLFITDKDEKILENTMVCKLADKSKLSDTSWIKPGMASWEWWNGASPYGEDVNFTTGCNTETYKYFIDFASHYNIPYIIMDEGWAMSTRDPFTPNKDIDIHELIKYGKEKNVGIVLWLTWLTVDNNISLFKTFEEWGIKGVKIDFMDRSDQWMVNFYERTAKEAAKHHLFVDFHGAFKPAGLEYKYPNILSYEGVRGMEKMGGCQPNNSIYLPFIRNAVGAMDYTPGAMMSTQPEVYYSKRPNSASVGTRAYQMALFVVFESGLQMLADNPTLYYSNDECTQFISKVPQTWDETRALKAKVGEYVIIAKRKGNMWYIGGMTNNNQTQRDFEINLDFLDKDKSYQIESFMDGTNASRQAMDFRHKKSDINSNDKINVRMVRNGGFAAVINQKE